MITFYVKIATCILIVVCLLIIYLCAKKKDAMTQVVKIAELTNEDFKQKNRQTTMLYLRERTLNKLLVGMLLDLLHSTTKQSLRWKFHVLRQLEPLFGADHGEDGEAVYTAIMDILSKGKQPATRDQFYADVKKITEDYFIMDREESQALMEILREIIDTSEKIDDAKLDSDRVKMLITEAARNLSLNFEVLDTSPLGDVPDPHDAEVLQSDRPLSREEALERLIAVARECTPIADDAQTHEETQVAEDVPITTNIVVNEHTQDDKTPVAVGAV